MLRLATDENFQMNERGIVMNKTLTVVFDGHVFHPDSPLNLEPNTRYVVTIQDVLPPAAEGDAWDVLEALTGPLKRRKIGPANTITISTARPSVSTRPQHEWRAAVVGHGFCSSLAQPA